jgi:hypothetical protein
MTIAYADFIAALPEFSNSTTYPETAVNFWINIAYQQINPCRFGQNLDLAATYYVAHFMVLEARDAAAAATGKVVGEATGPVNSKSLDKASIGYDTTAAASKGAGQWNLTTYGQRLYAMMRAFCSGPSYRAPRRRAFGTSIYR